MGFSLTGYSFWLQGNRLDAHRNLVDQCVEGKGLVQIDCSINESQRKIHIVDVLRPTQESIRKQKLVQDRAIETRIKAAAETNVHWAIDNNFKREQIRLNIPSNPADWDKSHVSFWLGWAIRKFNVTQINEDDWKIDGDRLCKITLKEFKSKVPHDPGDLFWTHFELLRKCKYVAVRKVGPPKGKREPPQQQTTANATIDADHIPESNNSSVGITEDADGNVVAWRRSFKLSRPPKSLVELTRNNCPIQVNYI